MRGQRILFAGGLRDLAPKVNIGYSAGPLTRTADIFTWTEEDMDFLECNFIGAPIGCRF